MPPVAGGQSSFSGRPLASKANVAKGPLLPTCAFLGRRFSCATVGASSASPATVIPCRGVAGIAIPTAIGYRQAALAPCASDERPSTSSLVTIAAGLVPRETTILGISAAVAPLLVADAAVIISLPTIASKRLGAVGKARALISEACVAADAVVLAVDEAVVPRPDGATFVSSAASEGRMRLGLEVILRPIRDAALVGGRPTEDISSLTLSS